MTPPNELAPKDQEVFHIVASVDLYRGYFPLAITAQPQPFGSNTPEYVARRVAELTAIGSIAAKP